MRAWYFGYFDKKLIKRFVAKMVTREEHPIRAQALKHTRALSLRNLHAISLQIRTTSTSYMNKQTKKFGQSILFL